MGTSQGHEGSRAGARAAIMTALLAAVFVAGAADGSSHLGEGQATAERVRRIAAAAEGRLTETALLAAFSDMDPGMKALAELTAPLPRASLGGRAHAPTQSRDDEPALLSRRALEALSWDAARLVNASVPFSEAPNPAARPFRIAAGSEDRSRALQCLTEAVYYEAGFESVDGKRAVAQVVLNRLRHPLYPKTVCGVVYEGASLATGCQFTFTCDGALARTPVEWAWKEARIVAEQALGGRVFAPVGYATHYHADYVTPYWLPSLSKVAQVGTHIFYRWPGGLGSPAAFRNRYAGAEPAVRLAQGETAADPDPDLKALAEAMTAQPQALAPPPKRETVKVELAEAEALEADGIRAAPRLTTAAVDGLRRSAEPAWIPPAPRRGGSCLGPCPGF